MKSTHIWNVTTKVAPSIHDKWLIWLKTVHIPAYLETGCFYDAVLLKMLGQETSDGFTYAVQFHSSSASLYQQFYENHYQALHKAMQTAWGDDCLGFSSLLEVVN